MRPDRRLWTGIAGGAIVMLVWSGLRRSGMQSGWMEFIFACSAVGLLLASLRWSTAAQANEPGLEGGHRHVTQTVPQWDPPLASTNEAVSRFLDDGDAEPLLARVQGSAAAPSLQVLAARPKDAPMALVHPAWSYAGFAAGLATAMVGIASAVINTYGVAGPFVVGFAMTLAGMIAYARFLNRYGGPWVVRTAWGAGALLLTVAGLLVLPFGRLLFVAPAATYTSIGLLAMVAFLAFMTPVSRDLTPKWVAHEGGLADLTTLRQEEGQSTIKTLVAGAIVTAVLVAVGSVSSLPDAAARIMAGVIAIIPPVTIGVVLPRAMRVLGTIVGGPAAVRRAKQQRAQRANDILRLIRT